jgi:hypothetical protein
MAVSPRVARWFSRNSILGALAGVVVGFAGIVLFAFGIENGVFNSEWWQIAIVFLPGLALTGWLIGEMQEWGEGVGLVAAPIIVSVLILLVRMGNPWSVILIVLLAFPACIGGVLTGALARVLRHFLSSRELRLQKLNKRVTD